MEAIEEKYDQFTDIHSEEELGRQAERYQTADQRERKLPIRIFFWLMVLSAGQPKARGALFQMVASFVGALSGLFPMTRNANPDQDGPQPQAGTDRLVFLPWGLQSSVGTI